MEIKKPRSGKQRELWDLLIPNKGYSVQEIEKIVEDHNLGKWTAGII